MNLRSTLLIFAVFLVPITAQAQIRAVEEIKSSGEITAKAKGQLTIKTKNKGTITFKIQDKGVRGLIFDGRLINVPTQIKVTANYKLSDLQKDDYIRFQAIPATESGLDPH